jgi:VanZ family protein
MLASRQRSSASVLALAYAALVFYASLYPFEGWHWLAGQSPLALLVLPRSPYHDAFDIVSNLAGYLPLGALLTLTARSRGHGALAAGATAVLVASVLSYGCELMQQFVPSRVPSLEDWALNSAGALVGALLALAAHALGLVRRWRLLRERWFERDAAVALALLALWPVGLLFPAPVPLAMGQVGERLREALSTLFDDVPWAEAAHAWLAAAPTPTTLRPITEALIVALGLLAPCLVAAAVMAPGRRRVALAAGALALGVLGMTLSTWLNFGPAHALAWFTPATGLGLGLGLVLALPASLLPRRQAAGIGLVVLTGLVFGVAQAPGDPYFAQSLQAWEQGRFVRFHGLAQWIGWLWPYAAMVWLLSRLGARD